MIGYKLFFIQQYIFLKPNSNFFDFKPYLKSFCFRKHNN